MIMLEAGWKIIAYEHPGAEEMVKWDYEARMAYRKLKAKYPNDKIYVLQLTGFDKTKEFEAMMAAN